MIETVTSSLWEDLIHSQRWEELRARLTATHSSDIAEAMGQIHAKSKRLSSASSHATTRLRCFHGGLHTAVSKNARRCSPSDQTWNREYPARVAGAAASAVDAAMRQQSRHPPDDWRCARALPRCGTTRTKPGRFRWTSSARRSVFD